ncbi:MAG: hypothetical protein A2V76_09535 [Candidatus Aminicenantes bacterium RBG_16_63_14]|nr:MAG: hypothetical protein A2V76_09535 [Candidatus Aminicenantes bacterium RBG_16_63_14]OGD28497.1 MAG: hypothetical protein A2V57_01215 [Candidatus Aminicenantes bacterium RBG_19FT_COMBO_65_30]
MTDRPPGSGGVIAYLSLLAGLGHNIMTLATGRYLDGYAGGFSGIGLAISGTFLFVLLLRKSSGRSII